MYNSHGANLVQKTKWWDVTEFKAKLRETHQTNYFIDKSSVLEKTVDDKFSDNEKYQY